MRNGSRIKYWTVIISLLLGAVTAMAQREKNYIFLFDCTNSMINYKLWDPAKIALDQNISLRASIPGSSFAVIPFGNEAYEVFSFPGSSYSGRKTAIDKSFEKYIKEAKYTNITAVLEEAFSRVNPKMDNEIYLLTDGMPNGADSADKVAQAIRSWCANHRNAKLFYVALKNNVINPVIKAAIDECPDASTVQCENGIIPVIMDMSTDIYTNLEELDKTKVLTFSIPIDFELTASSTDSLFIFAIPGNRTVGGKTKVQISPKSSYTKNQLHQVLEGDEYHFPVRINCSDSRFVITNPIVNIHISDDIPSSLEIAQGVDEIKAEPVSWHDSFLWSDAAPNQIVRWDLAPVFSNELKNSALDFRFQAAAGQPDDFKVWFNGQPLSQNGSFKIEPGKPGVLEVEFNHDAKTGKRYFNLVPAGITALEQVNGVPSDSYEGTSLRTIYIVDWNPLKTFFFWFMVVLLGALVLWFAVLKRIFFPTIRMGKITFAGPGSYYASKKIKGCRKVILTSTKKSQNVVSRLFSGKVLYIRANHFSPELTILPVGRKRKVKITQVIKSSNAWDIYPAGIFSQFDKGSITNRVTNEQSEIDFS